MEVMYIKYTNGTRHSIIKEGENIIMNDSKIIPLKHVKKVTENKCNRNFNYRKNSIMSTNDNKIDEEITNFFFDAIHKNYLSNRKKYR